MGYDLLPDWLPAQIVWQAGDLAVVWRYLGTRRLREPFYDQTLANCPPHPQTGELRRVTPLTTLLELYHHTPGLPPSGLIFHGSRCGSTLLAQLLGALPQHVVIAEAAPIDTLLRNTPAWGNDQRIAGLRAVVSAIGQRRQPTEQRLFIKFDAWHINDLPLLARAFPGVPWLFLYRAPAEVLASHTRQRGRHMVPGVLQPPLLNPAPGTPPAALDSYAAQVLAQLYSAAVAHYHPSALLLNYQQLPQATWEVVAAHVGCSFSEHEVATMQRVAHFDAKQPTQQFSPARQPPSPALRHLANYWVQPVYQRLETLRGA